MRSDSLGRWLMRHSEGKVQQSTQKTETEEKIITKMKFSRDGMRQYINQGENKNKKTTEKQKVQQSLNSLKIYQKLWWMSGEV